MSEKRNPNKQREPEPGELRCRAIDAMEGMIKHEGTGDKPYGAFFKELRQKQGEAQEGIFQVKTMLTLLATAPGEISAGERYAPHRTRIEEIYVPQLARILGMLVDKIDIPLQEMDALIINQKGLEEFCDKVECQRNEACLSIHKIRTILALLDGHDTSVKDLREAGIDLCSIQMVLQDFTDKADACVDEIEGLIIKHPDKEEK